MVSLASLLIHFGLFMTATWSRRGEVEKEKEDSVALDTEGQRFTQVSYRDACNVLVGRLLNPSQNNAMM